MVRCLAALLLWALVIGPTHAGDSGRQGVTVGDVLPDVPLMGLNGPSSRTSAFRGRPLIINVWASWCGPCRQEMASLERLAWRDTGRFSVIGISTDDHAMTARAFLARSHATIAHFLDQQLRLETLLGAERLPLTVLVDARGRVLEKIYGARDWDSRQASRLLERHFGPAL